MRKGKCRVIIVTALSVYFIVVVFLSWQVRIHAGMVWGWMTIVLAAIGLKGILALIQFANKVSRQSKMIESLRKTIWMFCSSAKVEIAPQYPLSFALDNIVECSLIVRQKNTRNIDLQMWHIEVKSPEGMSRDIDIAKDHIPPDFTNVALDFKLRFSGGTLPYGFDEDIVVNIEGYYFIPPFQPIEYRREIKFLKELFR